MRLFVFVALILVVPGVALAGNPILGGPLVYCADPPFCQACDLVQTANNGIRFAVAFSVIVATIAFLYAGILYFTAAADPKNIEKAHNIFKSVFVGLVILLVAWLVIDIVMRTLTESKWGPWNEISCRNYPSAGVLERGPTGAGPETDNETTRPVPPYTGPAGSCVNQSQTLATQVSAPANTPQCRPQHFTRSQDSIDSAISTIRNDPSIMNAISQCARQHGVRESDIVALMVQESSGRRSARDGNTYGLMQLGPNDAKNDNPALRGLTDQEVIAILQNTSRNPQYDVISVCTGAARIRRIQNQYPDDPRRAIAAYNTTGGLQPSSTCPGVMRLECPYYSQQDLSRCGANLNWSGNPRGTCFAACDVTCARLDNFETIERTWNGGG